MSPDGSRIPPRSRRFRSERERPSYRDAPYKREPRRSFHQDFLSKNCKRPGHYARDCPNIAVCNNCGLPGFFLQLFEVPLENSEAVLRCGSALVQSATTVFWIDIQTYTRHFFYPCSVIYLRKLPLSQTTSIKFLYRDHLLEDFMKQYPSQTNAFLVGGTAVLFVIELTDQLQKLKVESVLLHSLSHMRAFQGWELRMTTNMRLKACLYSFMSPGGPMYPTRAVRHAAWDALDLCFPVRRHPQTCDKPLLPFALSLVLALIMLEFHNHLASLQYSTRY